MRGKGAPLSKSGPGIQKEMLFPLTLTLSLGERGLIHRATLDGYFPFAFASSSLSLKRTLRM